MKSKLSTIIITVPLLLLAGEHEDIDKAIAQAPDMMLSQTNEVGVYIRQTCESISKLPDPSMRYRCFRNFMESACKVRLEGVETMVPLQPIKIPEVEEFRRENLRKVLQHRAIRFREMKIASIRDEALGRLRLLADQIYGCLLLEIPLPAPSAEQLEPYFKLIEKLQEEERKQKLSSGSLCAHAIDQVENYFLSYLRIMKNIRKTPSQQDLAATEARFKQVVGRPIRSAEQYEADARRRMEENIKEHQKQQESNRR